MKHISLTAATETLKSFFPDYPDSDVVSLQDIYISCGRDPNKPDQNKNWVGNKLTHLKHYDLVKPLYAVSPDRRKILDKIQLTKNGDDILKRAVQETKQNIDPEISEVIQEDIPLQVTLESIARDIRYFEKLNPSIELDLSIKMRKDIST